MGISYRWYIIGMVITNLVLLEPNNQYYKAAIDIIGGLFYITLGGIDFYRFRKKFHLSVLIFGFVLIGYAYIRSSIQ